MIQACVATGTLLLPPALRQRTQSVASIISMHSQPPAVAAALLSSSPVVLRSPPVLNAG